MFITGESFTASESATLPWILLGLGISVFTITLMLVSGEVIARRLGRLDRNLASESGLGHADNANLPEVPDHAHDAHYVDGETLQTLALFDTTTTPDNPEDESVRGLTVIDDVTEEPVELDELGFPKHIPHSPEDRLFIDGTDNPILFELLSTPQMAALYTKICDNKPWQAVEPSVRELGYRTEEWHTPAWQSMVDFQTSAPEIESSNA